MSLISLKAMAENKANSVSKTTQFKIDPRELVVEPGFNIRIEDDGLRAHIDSMKAAMREGACFPPLDVRVSDGKVIVVEGHCRRRAMLELIDEGFEIESCEVRHYRGSDAERVAHMLGTGKGKSYSPLEQGIAYLRLIRFGWDVAKIAARDGGKSTTHVENMILLAEANMDVQNMLMKGEVSTKVAIDTLRKHGDKAGPALAGLLDKAKATGSAKVTNKTVNGAALPRKLVSRFTASLDNLFSAMPAITKEGLPTADDDTTVPVSVRSLKELMAAHAELEQIRAKASHVG